VIASPNYSQRSGRTPRLVIIHTAEGARTVESLGNFFRSAAVQASSHVGIDDKRIEQYVPYSMAAWTAGGANSISDQAELCGFASWSRQVWLTQHMRMLELTAQWVRERCLARGIPIVKITPKQVAAGSAGVCGHVDWTVGTGEGSHWDPGPQFPWDVVMNLANGGITTTPVPAPSPAPKPAPRPRPLEDEAMYIFNGTTDGTNPARIALLSGSLFVGLGTVGEKNDALGNIQKGALRQWVEDATWDALDRQSHRVHDNPRPVVIVPPGP